MQMKILPETYLHNYEFYCVFILNIQDKIHILHYWLNQSDIYEFRIMDVI